MSVREEFAMTPRGLFKVYKDATLHVNNEVSCKYMDNKKLLRCGADATFLCEQEWTKDFRHYKHGEETITTYAWNCPNK